MSSAQHDGNADGASLSMAHLPAAAPKLCVVKGVAGNMMAREVHDLAAELNQTAKAEDPRVAHQACQLADSLDRLLAAAEYLSETG